jgi:oligopeptide transport system permease protein
MFLIVTAAFFMMRAAPGGPFDVEGQRITPEILRNIMAAYRLDQPLYVQYFDFLGDLLRGDLGPSYKIKDFTVVELISAGLPPSAKLGLISLAVATVAGIGLGVIAALRQNTWGDYAVMSLAMTGIAVPNFVIAALCQLAMLQIAFATGLHLLPLGGWGDGAVRNIVLPVIALTLPQIAFIARLMRGSLIEVLRSNYVRTARAKGLREQLVLVRHSAKAALLPVISYLGPAAAGLMTGSVIIETIFQLPGIGRYFVNAALNRDYTLVMGVVIVYGAAIILFNLLVDLVYGLLDPKVKIGR